MADALVVDASALLAVLLGESETEWIRSTLEDFRLLAPGLIRFETANGIVTAHRQDRGVPLDRLELVQEYPIVHPVRRHWWTRAGQLVKTHSLTFYGASYVALASVMDQPLLTLDEQVRTRCDREGIPLYSP